ncbi:MAG: hypothetical protein AAFY34_15805 [Pseudomonadota bacterium]
MTIIPQTYEEWEHCITVKCGIPLTSDYVAKRIKALQNVNEMHTRQFIDRWGEAHHAQTLQWFQQAANKLEQ